jgi:alpha/beta superfamily hydrolase
MQLLMRRPEINGFISIAPPANMYDFSFLAPCPSSGIIVHGDRDELVPEPSVKKLVDKLSAQRGITIDYRLLPGADHFFEEQLDDMVGQVEDYVDEALAQPVKRVIGGRR